VDQVRQDRADLASHLQRQPPRQRHPQIRNPRHPQLPIEQGIGEAINFHEGIGSKRKEQRIGYLKNYWATRAQQIPKVNLHTSLNLNYSCAICGVSIDGMTPGAVASALFDKYKIHTVGIVWENISCVRVTPHVYTTLPDLDKLVTALGEIAAKA